MQAQHGTARGAKGQMLALFALAGVVIMVSTGLVIDGGFALGQRRSAQNAADFASLAGARIVAQRLGGNTVDGTDANVRSAINATLASNQALPMSYGLAGSPIYVTRAGANAGFVGSGSIPNTAVGVQLNASVTWQAFFTGIVGIRTWTASASATALGGFTALGPPGAVFPAGIAQAFFNGRRPCGAAQTGVLGGTGSCDPQMFTNGTTNVPGGFGWLKFGCVGYGLGQVAPANVGGCDPNKPFLQTEIGPPANSFGCCSKVGLAGSADLIGSLPGNKASANCDYWVNTKATVTIAVWDSAGGTGNNAYYHIVGFTGFQITGCDGGKNIQGVWRVPFFVGPTTSTPGFAGEALAVELVK